MRSELLAALPLIALALLAPTALAQLPSQSCSTLELAHETAPAFEPDSRQQVAFVVTNAGDFADVRTTVRVVATDTAWVVSPGEMTTTLGPGDAATLRFNVTSPPAREAGVTLNAVAEGVCTAGGQTFPGTLPANPGAVPQVTDSMALRTTRGGGFDLPGLDSLASVSPLYFIGGLGAVVVVLGAVIAARRQGDGFDVASAEPDKGVRPGRGASFPLDVKNRGRQPDTARFEVGEVPAGWTAFMALSELTLAPGESRTLWLMVRAPPTAPAGSACVVPVVVRSKANPRREGRVAVRAEVKAEADGSSSGGVEATRVG